MGSGSDSSGLRTCRACGAPKPLASFPEYRPGRRRRRCQPCINAQRAARRSADPESADRVRSRQRDAVTERARLEAYEKSPAGRAARRKRRHASREHVNAQNRSYRERDREAAREQSRRHMRLRRAGYSGPLLEWTDVLAADPCAYCSGASSGVDHIEAIADGGANAAENLIGACFDCNRQKRTQPLLAFLAGRG